MRVRAFVRWQNRHADDGRVFTTSVSELRLEETNRHRVELASMGGQVLGGGESEIFSLQHHNKNLLKKTKKNKKCITRKTKR